MNASPESSRSGRARRGHRPSAVVGLVLILLLAFVPSAAIGVAQEEPSGVEVGGVTVLPPDAEVGGAGIAEWDARLWQWSITLPEASNPSFNPDAGMCGYGQFGPVFFLPPSYTPEPVTMECTVPEGTAIFVSVAASGCTSVEEPPFFGSNEEELRACAEEDFAGFTDLEITINGELVPELGSYQTSTPLFTLNFGEDNFYGLEPVVAYSVATSQSIIIAPPAPGEYEIVASGAYPADDVTFASTIRLVVEAPTVNPPSATPQA